MDQKTTIVAITDNAAEKVKALMEQEGEEDLALRIGVRPGGCSGFQYSIYFDDEINDDDEIIETKGVKVLIDAMSVRGWPDGCRLRRQQPERPGRLRLRQLVHLLV
jgi:iron-sulfur cluster assembly accessory protein